MNESTIQRLNALNREFYRQTVQNFDESRGRPWPGWKRLLSHLNRAEISVLDVGCGNGRFGRFLARNLAETVIRYHGVDHTPALLDAARTAFQKMHILPDARLEERDIVENPPESGAYTLVVLFGVLHHIPGAAVRSALLRTLAERTAPGGLLVYTSWCFYEYERFRERLIDWPADLAADVESGDYVMDWRRGHAALSALRYCHYVDQTEQAQLTRALESSGFVEIDNFRADGHTNDINRYSVLERRSTHS